VVHVNINEVYICRRFFYYFIRPDIPTYIGWLFGSFIKPDGSGRQGKNFPDYLRLSVSQGLCSMELVNTEIQNNLPFSMNTVTSM
jgi:hypothetical protein